MMYFVCCTLKIQKNNKTKRRKASFIKRKFISPTSSSKIFGQVFKVPISNKVLLHKTQNGTRMGLILNHIFELLSCFQCEI